MKPDYKYYRVACQVVVLANGIRDAEWAVREHLLEISHTEEVEITEVQFYREKEHEQQVEQ